MPKDDDPMTLVSNHMDSPNPTPSQASGEPIPADRVCQIIAGIDIAMLVTRWSDGLRGRPMSTIPTPEKGAIYILTEGRSPAAQDVGKDGAVFLSCQGRQGRGDHVALQGQASVNPENGLVKELWNPGAQVFWPKGPEEHDVVTIVIDPGHADVWDGHGLSRGIANIVRGAATGQSPDLRARGEVDL